MNNVKNNYKTELETLLRKDEDFLKIGKILSDSSRKISIFCAVTIIFLVIGIGVLLFPFSKGEDEYNKPYALRMFYIGLSITAIGLFFLVKWRLLAKKSKKIIEEVVKPLIISTDWSKYYNLAKNLLFPNAKWHLTEIELNSINIGGSDVVKNFKPNLIKGKINNVNFTFDTEIRIKERVFFDKDGIRHVTYESEIIDSAYCKLPFNKDIGQVKLLPKKARSKSDYETESIVFNKNYSLKTLNNLFAVKLFTPSTIDKYNNIVMWSNRLNSLNIINDNMTCIFYQLLNGIRWDLQICNFKVYKKLNSFVSGIASEILEDIKRVHLTSLFLEPML